MTRFAPVDPFLMPVGPPITTGTSAPPIPVGDQDIYWPIYPFLFPMGPPLNHRAPVIDATVIARARNLEVGSTLILTQIVYLDGHLISGPITFREPGYHELVVGGPPYYLFPICIIDPTQRIRVQVEYPLIQSATEQALNRMLQSLPPAYARGRVVPSIIDRSAQVEALAYQAVALELRGDDSQKSVLGYLLAPRPGRWPSTTFTLPQGATRVVARVVIEQPGDLAAEIAAVTLVGSTYVGISGVDPTPLSPVTDIWDILVIGGYVSDNATTLCEWFLTDTNEFVPAPSLEENYSSFPNAAVTMLDGRVMFRPGSWDGFKDSEVFDRVLNYWSQHLPMYGGVDNGGCAPLTTGDVLVVGGNQTPGVISDIAELFNPTTNWNPVVSLPTPRGGHMTWPLADGKALVAGGWDDSWDKCTDSLIYEGGDWTVVGGLNIPRGWAVWGTQLPDGRPMAIGGDDDSDDGSPYTCEIFDLNTRTWLVTGDLHVARDYFAVVALPDGRVFVAGGDDPLNDWDPIAETEMWSPETGEWTVMAPMSVPRAGFTLTLRPDGKVMAIGGYDQDWNSLGTTEIYDVDANEWTPGPDLHFGIRADHAVALVKRVPVPPPRGEDLLIIGGYSDEWGDLNSCLWYLPDEERFVPAPDLIKAEYLSNDAYLTMPGNKVMHRSGWYTGASRDSEVFSRALDCWVPYTTVYPMNWSRMGGVGGRGFSPITPGGYNTETSTISGECDVFDRRTGLWASVEALNHVRYQHGVWGIPGGGVLVAGGNGVGWALEGSTEFRQWYGGSWTTLSDMQHPRGWGCWQTQLLDGRPMAIGGDDDSESGGTVTCEIFDLETMTWGLTGDMHMERDYYGVVVLPDGRVFVSGGEDAQRDWDPDPRCEIWDPATGEWTEVAPLLAPRCGHTMTILPDGKVMVIGGYDGEWNATATTEIYDLDADEWVLGPEMPFTRADHCAVSMKRAIPAQWYVLITGGEGAGGACSSWDPVGGVRVRADLAAGGRYDHELVRFPSGSVAAVKGAGNGPDNFTSIELYDPYLEDWHSPVEDVGWGYARFGVMLAADPFQEGSPLYPPIIYAMGIDAVSGYNSRLITPIASTNGPWGMNWPRTDADCVFLPSGRFFSAGGNWYPGGGQATLAEVTTFRGGGWAGEVASMNKWRVTWHKMVLLGDGGVLVVGGAEGDPLACEVYREWTDSWYDIAPMLNDHGYDFRVVKLLDGRVLVAGGAPTYGAGHGGVNCEIYNPVLDSWTAIPDLNHPHNSGHTLTLLPDGTVLCAGGLDDSDNPSPWWELYSPTTNTWTDVESGRPHTRHAACVVGPIVPRQLGFALVNNYGQMFSPNEEIEFTVVVFASDGSLIDIGECVLEWESIGGDFTVVSSSGDKAVFRAPSSGGVEDWVRCEVTYRTVQRVTALVPVRTVSS